MELEEPELFRTFMQEIGEPAEEPRQPKTGWIKVESAALLYYCSHGMSLASVAYILHTRYVGARERTIEELRETIELCRTFIKHENCWNLRGTNECIIGMFRGDRDYFWGDFVNHMSFSKEEKEYLTGTGELDEITKNMGLGGKETDPKSRAMDYYQAAPVQHAEPHAKPKEPEDRLDVTSLQRTLPEIGSIPAVAPLPGGFSMGASAGASNQGKGKERAHRDPPQPSPRGAGAKHRGASKGGSTSDPYGKKKRERRDDDDNAGEGGKQRRV